VRYTATNFGSNSDANQCSDFYLAVMQESKHGNKVFLVPVESNYQFKQEIEGFKDTFGVAEDNEAIKNMTYMQKKTLLV
jgi:hypothetical protein